MLFVAVFKPMAVAWGQCEQKKYSIFRYCGDEVRKLNHSRPIIAVLKLCQGTQNNICCFQCWNCQLNVVYVFNIMCTALNVFLDLRFCFDFATQSYLCKRHHFDVI